MPVRAHERVAVLVVRAWTEGDPPALRARITRTDDISEKNDLVKVVTSPGAVRHEVDAWLNSFLGSGGAANDDRATTP